MLNEFRRKRVYVGRTSECCLRCLNSLLKITVMEETFFININCSEILANSDETQYTMLIDCTKMSIVFELIEWIRWIFSVETCVYLTHESLVIHELEDIQVLLKLKNLKIKPCGRVQCVHTKAYRTLLNNSNFFVSWNEAKVPKYFLDKINQMSHKLTVETNNQLKITKVKDFRESPSYESNKNETDSSEMRSLNKLSQKPRPEDSSITKKRALFDNFEIRTNSASPKEINESFSNSPESKKKFFPLSEGSYNFKSRVNPSDKSQSNISISPVSVINSLRNEPEIDENVAKSKKEKRFTKYRPFCVGEVLSSIRESLEKQNTETNPYKTPSLGEEENSDALMTTKEDFSNLEDETEIHKRKRIRRRKKGKKKNSEEMDFMFSSSEAAPTFKSPNLSSNFKPNHIRFDVYDENNFSETVCNNGTANVADFNNLDHVRSQNEIKVNLEPQNLNAVTSNNLMDLESEMINANVRNENEMEHLEVDNQINNKEKIVDIDDSGCDNSSLIENFQRSSSVQGLTMVDLLKDKFKNAVVVKRFY